MQWWEPSPTVFHPDAVSPFPNFSPREGKATDDDMQSIASLMSMPGFSDVGRMEDLDDMEGELNEEDEDRAQAEERDNEFRETMGKFSELSKK